MYDQAVQAQFINTYAPINFSELYRIGATQKAAMDEAAQQFGAALQKFGEFRSPSAVDTQNWYNLTIGRKDMQDAINQLATNPEALKDAGFRASLQSLINSTDYASLSKLMQSRDAMLQRQELNQKLTLENRFNPLWHDVDFNSYDTLNNNIFNDLNPIPYMSIQEMVQPYVDNLKGEFLGRKNGFIFKGVNEQMTDDQLRRNWSSIQNTPQYNKYMEILMKQGYTQQDAADELQKQIFTAGREFTWNDPQVDPWAIEQMKLQAKYANASGVSGSGSLNNLNRIVGQDSRRTYLLQFSGLSPEKVDAYMRDGESALTDQDKLIFNNNLNPQSVQSRLRLATVQVSKANNSYRAGENFALDMLSTNISNEASEIYSKIGTTNSKVGEKEYKANNSRNFILASDFLNQFLGRVPKDNKFSDDWNKGTVFNDFNVVGTDRIITDGMNAYHLKYAIIPRSQGYYDQYEDNGENKIETKYSSNDIVGVNARFIKGNKNIKSTTTNIKDDGTVSTTTKTEDTDDKIIVPVLTPIQNYGESAITQDALWNDVRGLSSKTTDIQNLKSEIENIYNYVR